MLGYRIINDESLKTTRSFCPKCRHTLTPIDLIPILSWLLLKAKCRYCNSNISFLYPFIELITAVSLTSLLILNNYFFSYFILFSALIVTIRTDMEKMLISRLVTLYLIPLGFLLSYYNLLPISSLQSLIGSILGFFSLYIINKIFYIFTKKQGIGEGDFELLALIGSFTGPIGVFYSIFIGSILGSLLGIILIILNKSNLQSKLPFGPFLANGAIIYILFL
jgi:leader peptidase (prepilin peptidase) / N-methyltransferase